MRIAATRVARWACAALLFLPLVPSYANEIPAAERRSGYSFMSQELKTMQDDRTANPGMLSVLDGERLWKQKPEGETRACAGCHGDARKSMKGVAARYPAFSATLKKPINLEQRINLCRTERQHATPFAYE